MVTVKELWDREEEFDRRNPEHVKYGQSLLIEFKLKSYVERIQKIGYLKCIKCNQEIAVKNKKWLYSNYPIMCFECHQQIKEEING